VIQPEHVSRFVNDLFPQAVREDLFGRKPREPTIGGGAETIRGDDTTPAVEIGKAENVVPAAVIQVRSGQTDRFRAASNVGSEFDKRLRVVLVPTGVIGILWEVLIVGDRHLSIIDRTKHGGGFAFDRWRDVPDRNQVDAHGTPFRPIGHKHLAVNRTPPSLLEVLSPYEQLLEVGIGHRTDVAAALAAAGADVTALDVTERDAPPAVRFLIEDVTDPDPERYDDVDAIYALALPPDLQVPVADLAKTLSVPLYFTTLGADPPVVPIEIRTIQEGTLYVLSDRGGSGLAQ
jgi:uncharacterized UPF0146 family protein